MEGNPKSSAEKPQKDEAVKSPEHVAEMVKEARETFNKLREYNDVEILGEGAIEAKRYTEDLALELTKTLEKIPRKDRLPNGLPDGPNIKAPEDIYVPMPADPAESGYAHTLNYTHAANDNQSPRPGEQQEPSPGWKRVG